MAIEFVFNGSFGWKADRNEGEKSQRMGLGVFMRHYDGGSMNESINQSMSLVDELGDCQDPR